LTEDKPSLADEVLADSRRQTSCSICAWIETSDDRDEWIRLLDMPWQQANTRAIHRSMIRRGAQFSDKTLDTHRRKGHRVGA
jgi:L-ribulose-5-phosphate 3-epimerase UlaE